MADMARRELAARMAEVAAELSDTCSPAQHEALRWQFDHEERETWFYTPTDHGGLSLLEMSPTQHRLTHKLLATGLSHAGYVTANAIITLENLLDQIEGWSQSFGRERARDPLLYWIAIFGDPSDDSWAWRFGGHHISLHFTIVDGDVVGTTPCFFGADPASSPLLGPHPFRPLGGIEDLARDLVHSLSDDQRRLTVLSPAPPIDIVTANRTTLTEGDAMLSIPVVWRGRLEESLHHFMANADAHFRGVVGLTDAHVQDLAFSRRPKGIAASALDDPQREMVRSLLDLYVGRVADEAADAQAAKYAGDRLHDVHFLWAGGTEPGDPMYYRLQGASLMVEYENAVRDANHVHTVWRDLDNDWGRDVLAEHHATHQHRDRHDH